MGWVYLLLAGLLEIAWPVGIKFYTLNIRPILSLLFAGLAMMLSGFFLAKATTSGVPIGTGYAVWTGIGTIGAFLIGIAFFEEPRDIRRFMCVGLIVVGIIGLKLVTPDSSPVEPAAAPVVQQDQQDQPE